MVAAINSRANANKDKTPIILAITTAAVLSFRKNNEKIIITKLSLLATAFSRASNMESCRSVKKSF